MFSANSKLAALISVKFTDDIEYWQENHFYYDFQKSITFWRWGGEDIKVFGSGVLNGSGQRWYNEFAGMEILVGVALSAETNC